MGALSWLMNLGFAASGSTLDVEIFYVGLPDRTLTVELEPRTLDPALPDRTLTVGLKPGGRRKA